MVWPVYDAKARFSELLDAALKDGPQIVSRRGVETAVLVPIDEWERLKGEKRESIKDILLDPNGPHDLLIPPRRRFRRRKPIAFE
ncbi:MAG TPA: type II toxin-antitoxin system Phd/YefM family antitoxin [Terracidiphilus sp.]|nr:type II toxin-antitoxin system Phd/YefM family antitoxin [Terracidiphilus sp.]